VNGQGAIKKRASRRQRRTRARKDGPAATQQKSPEFAPRGIAFAVREAMESLRWTVLALARARGLEQKLAGIELRFRVTREASAESLARNFLDELSARLDELQSEEESVVRNRAWCFRCESFLCDHSTPPTALSVLQQYEPTGRPCWLDFASFLYHRRDPRAEAVAERSAGIVAVVQTGEEVTEQRIEAFGGSSPQVEILSQLVAGPFPVGDGTGSDEGALTLQWLRVRRGSPARGQYKLVFHELGDARLLDMAGSVADPGLARILTHARAAARTHPWQHTSRKPAGASDPFREFAVAHAHELARDLQHYYSARSRRTRHAQKRVEGGMRPTAHAFPEARAASDEDIRIDQQTKTYVLLGRNSRVHFFNKQLQHVTSVRFAGEAIRARIDTNRWRRATKDEVVAFRTLLERWGGSGHTERRGSDRPSHGKK
jgi:hypothetical protein